MNELYRQWIDHYSDDEIRNETRVEYERNITRHILPHIGNAQLVNLTSQRLSRVFSHDLAELGAAGRRNAHRTLKNMISWAIANELMPASVWQLLKSEVSPD